MGPAKLMRTMRPARLQMPMLALPQGVRQPPEADAGADEQLHEARVRRQAAGRHSAPPATALPQGRHQAPHRQYGSTQVGSGCHG